MYLDSQKKYTVKNIITNEKQVIICSYGISFRRNELSEYEYDRIVCGNEAHLFF